MGVARLGGFVHRNIANCRLLRSGGAEICAMSSGGLKVKRLRAWDGMQMEIADQRPDSVSGAALAQEAP